MAGPYSEPTDIPAVERCAQKVVRQSNKDKSEAIPICVKTLKDSGRIRQNENGQWVVSKRQQKTRARG